MIDSNLGTQLKEVLAKLEDSLNLGELAQPGTSAEPPPEAGGPLRHAPVGERDE